METKRYQLVTYLGEFADELGVEPGIDQRINYDNLETAKLAAALACTLDLHDAALIYDRETGEVVDEVGKFPVGCCSIYE